MSTSETVSCLPYFTRGEVVAGFGRGSKQLGIPTGETSHTFMRRRGQNPDIVNCTLDVVLGTCVTKHIEITLKLALPFLHGFPS